MESEFVRWLRTRLPASEWLGLGPGDDAALLRLGASGQAVVTTDLLVDSVHFRLGTDHPRRIGRKLLAVNLSDLAAMAAEPVAVVVSLCIPNSGGLALAKELYEGLLPLAEEFQIAIAGGDTNCWDGPLVIDCTAIGRPTDRGLLRRDGGRAGDALLVTGAFGGSFLGKQFDFTPRIREALHLNRDYQLHAGMDCSDGLALDASRLAEASGCGLVLDLAAVPIAAAADQMAASSQRTPLAHALGDGEDFELLLAVPADEARRLLADQPLETPLTQVGEFVEELGLFQREDAGRKPLAASGYLHDDTSHTQ